MSKFWNTTMYQRCGLVTSFSCLALLCLVQDVNAGPDDKPLSIGYLLFPGFTMLDVYGPLEIITAMSYFYNMTLSTIAASKGPVSSLPPSHGMSPDMPPSDYSFMISTSTTATHSFEDAPDDLDILFVPGGMGNVALMQAGDTSLEDFVADRFDRTRYVVSVCTGAVTLARAGVLDGRKATTNKASWDMVTSQGADGNITWVPSARWVEDGKVWTSSGVTAGIDMTYAFMRHLFGDEHLPTVMSIIEYAPHTDPHWDPFSVVHKVPGADTDRSLADCVEPVEGSEGGNMSDMMDME